MESIKRAVLINASWGAWYPEGTKRLVRSIIHHGWNYEIRTWSNDAAINSVFNPEKPYTIKLAAIIEAVNEGFTHILWMDCSLWVIKDPNKLMEYISNDGGLFIKSGYNLAQTSADSDLLWAKESRDKAESLPELWSCIFGFNLETEQGKNFYKHLKDAYVNEVYETPRTHSGLSEDPRFLHARQDQTAVSWAYHKSGYNCLKEPGEILSNYNIHDKENANTIVLMRGM
jgi:hypothetical protein